MPPETVLVLITAALSSTVVGSLVGWWKDRAVSRATVEVSGVTALREALAALRIELEETRQDLHTTREEVCRLRTENAALGGQIRQLEEQLLLHQGRLG